MHRRLWRRRFWSRRLSTGRIGKAGELLACLILILQGYRILARNLRTPHAEVDILARHRGVLVVVEVKSRNGPAAQVLSRRQHVRLVRASDWAQDRWGRPGMSARIDLVRIEWRPLGTWPPWPRVHLERGVRYASGL